MVFPIDKRTGAPIKGNTETEETCDEDRTGWTLGTRGKVKMAHVSMFTVVQLILTTFQNQPELRNISKDGNMTQGQKKRDGWKRVVSD